MSKKEINIESIYNSYIDDLFHYAINFGFDREIIMDAIHDVFYRLSLNNSHLKNVDNVKFYLYRSLRNRLFDIAKTQKESLYEDIYALTQYLPFNIDITVEDSIINEEERTKIKSKIEEMLNVLTPRQREIVYLRYIDGYDYKEISKLLNITVPSCHKLISKSIHKLREKFGALVLLLLFC